MLATERLSWSSVSCWFGEWGVFCLFWHGGHHSTSVVAALTNWCNSLECSHSEKAYLPLSFFSDDNLLSYLYKSDVTGSSVSLRRPSFVLWPMRIILSPHMNDTCRVLIHAEPHWLSFFSLFFFHRREEVRPRAPVYLFCLFFCLFFPKSGVLVLRWNWRSSLQQVVTLFVKSTVG